MKSKSELDECVLMAWVGSPDVTNESIFRIPVSAKNSFALKKTWQKQSRVIWLFLNVVNVFSHIKCL